MLDGSPLVRPPGTRSPWKPFPGLVVAITCLAILGSQIVGCASQGPRSGATDGLVPSTTPAPSDAAETLVTFDAGGFSIDYPSSWREYRVAFPIGTLGSTVGVFGTADLHACEAQGDWRCVNHSNLGPGEVLLMVNTQVGVGSFADLEPPGGFTFFIDGAPAVVTSIGSDLPNGADGERVWTIGIPGRLDAWFTNSGLGGPKRPVPRPAATDDDRTVNSEGGHGSLPSPGPD